MFIRSRDYRDDDMQYDESEINQPITCHESHQIEEKTNLRKPQRRLSKRQLRQPSRERKELNRSRERFGIQTNRCIFRAVFPDGYGKDAAELLEPNILVSLYVPPEFSEDPNVLFHTSHLLGTQETPPKFTRTLHNHNLPRTRF